MPRWLKLIAAISVVAEAASLAAVLLPVRRSRA
jgi:hypothetical protein